MLPSTKKSFIEKIADSLSINRKFHKPQKDQINFAPNIIASPVQAKFIYGGKINSDLKIISKNKREIPLEKLLGNSSYLFSGGPYLNFYLKPTDKHYFRTPYDGEFVYTHLNQPKSFLQIPVRLGALFLNSNFFDSMIKRNASVGSVLQTEKFPIGMVAVGSLFVNSIHFLCEKDKLYEKGTVCGNFSIGSTMLLCLPNKPNLEILINIGQKIDIGQAIVKIN